LPNPLQILYVEDNPVVREITYELLCADDRQILALESAEEALAAFGQQTFDVLITDVSLPVMSGLDLVRNVLAKHPRLPVIIASGYALDFGTERWGRNVRSVIKPFEGSDIDALIEELTANAAAGR
jgi:CheY-like chemotaxis protein